MIQAPAISTIAVLRVEGAAGTFHAESVERCDGHIDAVGRWRRGDHLHQRVRRSWPVHRVEIRWATVDDEDAPA